MPAAKMSASIIAILNSRGPIQCASKRVVLRVVKTRHHLERVRCFLVGRRWTLEDCDRHTNGASPSQAPTRQSFPAEQEIGGSGRRRGGCPTRGAPRGKTERALVAAVRSPAPGAAQKGIELLVFHRRSNLRQSDFSFWRVRKARMRTT